MCISHLAQFKNVTSLLPNLPILKVYSDATKVWEFWIAKTHTLKKKAGFFLIKVDSLSGNKASSMYLADAMFKMYP